MKLNVGNWIIVAFILFAGFIGTLVTVCVRQDIDLVSKDYYQEELQYQDQIQRINNTSGLVIKPVFRMVDQELQVEFNQWNTIENGELKLFCPSNPQMDRNFLIVPSDQQVQSFGVKMLQKGMYRAKLMWKMNGKEFYLEEVVYI
jgi:hypothetical protein